MQLKKKMEMKEKTNIPHVKGKWNVNSTDTK